MGMEIKRLRRVFSIKEGCCELLYACIELPAFDTAGEGRKPELRPGRGGKEKDALLSPGIGINEKAPNICRGGEGRDAGAPFSLFSGYYRKAASCAEEWAVKFADETIRAEYLALSQRERKFSFRRYIYRVGFEVKEAEEGRILINCSYCLSRAGKVVFQKTKSDLWDAEYYLLCAEGGRGRRVWKKRAGPPKNPGK